MSIIAVALYIPVARSQILFYFYYQMTTSAPVSLCASYRGHEANVISGLTVMSATITILTRHLRGRRKAVIARVRSLNVVLTRVL